MPRYKLTLEYDGTGLVGWQRQDTGLSVQQVVETAAQRLCGEEIVVHGAGRTDAGVHALGQVAHLDLPREYPLDTIRSALNQHLKPHAVAVLAAERVGDAFDARRSARGRIYRYVILNRRAPPTVERDRVWHVSPTLDHAAMQEAARHLVGRHDFTTFRASLCQARSPVKTLDRLEVARVGRGNPHRGACPLVPAPPGAQHGRHAQAGGRRASGARATWPRRWRRATAAPAVRPRRRKGFISSR